MSEKKSVRGARAKIRQADAELGRLRAMVVGPSQSDSALHERMTTKSERRYSDEVLSASGNLEDLHSILVDNPSLLVKYRQNITVPVQWVPVQGIRAENIGMIPAENIIDLDRYITNSVKRIDGGDLDV